MDGQSGTEAQKAEIAETDTVACDGGPLGHPTIYLTVGEDGAECPYCGRRFVKAAQS